MNQPNVVVVQKSPFWGVLGALVVFFVVLPTCGVASCAMCAAAGTSSAVPAK